MSVETALKHAVSKGAIALLLLGGYCSVLCSCQTELFIEYTQLALAAAHSGIDARNDRGKFRFWPHVALVMAGSCYYTSILLKRPCHDAS